MNVPLSFPLSFPSPLYQGLSITVAQYSLVGFQTTYKIMSRPRILAWQSDQKTRTSTTLCLPAITKLIITFLVFNVFRWFQFSTRKQNTFLIVTSHVFAIFSGDVSTLSRRIFPFSVKCIELTLSTQKSVQVESRGKWKKIWYAICRYPSTGHRLKSTEVTEPQS